MKKSMKIIYWITTGIITLMMLFSAYSYLTNPDMKGAFTHLGFPNYFRIELAIAKFIGAILLIIPVSRSLKDITYAGFGLTFVSASVAHYVTGDPVAAWFTPIIFLLILLASFWTYNKLNSTISIKQ